MLSVLLSAGVLALDWEVYRAKPVVGRNGRAEIQQVVPMECSIRAPEDGSVLRGASSASWLQPVAHTSGFSFSKVFLHLARCGNESDSPVFSFWSPQVRGRAPPLVG